MARLLADEEREREGLEEARDVDGSIGHGDRGAGERVDVAAGPQREQGVRHPAGSREEARGDDGDARFLSKAMTRSASAPWA